jgi:hypothetical protein
VILKPIFVYEKEEKQKINTRGKRKRLPPSAVGGVRTTRYALYNTVLKDPSYSSKGFNKNAICPFTVSGAFGCVFRGSTSNVFQFPVSTCHRSSDTVEASLQTRVLNMYYRFIGSWSY